MSDIRDLLILIKTAIYGRDVRQAIHDAIQTCYEEGRAGVVDYIARERADLKAQELQDELTAYETLLNRRQSAFEASLTSTLNNKIALADARISAFTKTHGLMDGKLIKETTIWETQNPAPEVTPAVPITTYSQYTYIDLYIQTIVQGLGPIKKMVRATPEMLRIATTLDPIMYTMSEKTMVAIVPEISEEGTALHFTFKKWVWNGLSSSAATLRVVSDNGTGLTKMVGVKMQQVEANKDAELSDLRVAPDGTQYTSAGAMIRNQLSEIIQRLDDLGLYRDTDGDLCEEDE